MTKAKDEKVPVSEQAEASAATEEKTVVIVPRHEIDQLIRKRVYAAMTLGLAPIPVVDLIGLTAIQIELVRAIAKKYEVPFKGNRVKGVLGSLLGSVMPVGSVPLFASLMKFVPVIGYTTGAASASLLGGASTYAVGKVFERHFASGGDLLNFDTEKVQAGFKEQYKKGKEFISSMKKRPAAEDQSAEAAPQTEAAASSPA